MTRTIFSASLLLLTTLVVAEERAEEFRDPYLRLRVAPAVEAFILQNQLPGASTFRVHQITNQTFKFYPETPYAGATVTWLNKYVFNVHESRTGTVVRAAWSLQPNVARVMTRGDTNEMRQLASQPNLLTLETAGELANRFFRLQGHAPGDFTPPQHLLHVTSWGRPGDPDHIALPFYEFVWYRKPVAAELHPSQQPRLMIGVSGITSNLYYYSQLLMLQPEDRPTNLVELLETLGKEPALDDQRTNTP